MMRHFIISMLTLLVAFFSNQAYAQSEDSSGRHQKRQEMAIKQANYIADQLSLTDQTRDQFVKTFCDYQKEIWDLGPKVKPNKAKDDNEAAENAKIRFERSHKILELRERYYREYSKFLTPMQIEHVYQLEKKIMKKMSEKKKSSDKKMTHKKKSSDKKTSYRKKHYKKHGKKYNEKQFLS